LWVFKFGFCLLGGRLGPTLYIHFIRNWVKTRRRSSASREGEDETRADAPDGREADAERLVAVIKALTGVKPRIRRMKDGRIVIICYREHLDGFARFAELAEAYRGVAGGDRTMRAKAPVDR
jgi:hypothetical protein